MKMGIRFDGKGRITIPKTARDFLGLRRTDRLVLTVDTLNHRLILTKKVKEVKE